MVWYLARRHLNYEIDEWEALPWPTQLVYLEGLATEFYQEDPDTEFTDDVDLKSIEAVGAQVRRV